MKDYHINIFYSEKDQGYVADIPDLASCSAVGQTPYSALAKVELAKLKWLERAQAEEKPIPPPKYRPDIYNSTAVDAQAQSPAPTMVEADQPCYEEHLKYIKEKIAKHECILFLGSAIHSPAPPELTQFNYTREMAPPIGSALSGRLAERSDYPREDWWNLQRVSQHFESKTQSRFRLVEEIKDAIHVDRQPSPILRMLANLEFPIVITTNYDHLYEQALDRKAEEEKAANQTVTKYQVSIYNPNKQNKAKTVDCLDNPDPKKPYVLKIHGDIDQPQSIVLTEEDYIQFVLRMSDKQPYNPFGKNVLARLVKWPTLFIGYSLTDYNLRLLFKTLRWNVDASQIPPNYSVDKKPDELIRDVLESQRRYVSFIILNLWECIPKIHADLGKVLLP